MENNLYVLSSQILLSYLQKKNQTNQPNKNP